MTWTTPGYKQPPGWKQTRARILKRDAYTCYLCNEPGHEVDHKIPVHLGGGHDDDNLAAICTPCHKAKTQAEATRARPRRRREPEEHPNRSTRRKA